MVARVSDPCTRRPVTRVQVVLRQTVICKRFDQGGNKGRECGGGKRGGVGGVGGE